MEKIHKTKEEWRQSLSPEAFAITRNGGTERPFTGKYWNNHDKGIYQCIACDLPLFSSDTKFESGTGWPSFYAPIAPDAVDGGMDTTHGMIRTETTCARCDSHLGHVFDDGPAPTGLRYCMNSGALKFVPAGSQPTGS